jgi:hypothetical protein
MDDAKQAVFPGYCYYLEVAARERGLYDAVAPSRSNRVLANLGNLCSQAPASDDPARIAEILRGVESLASQLELASLAGAKMVDELRARLVVREEVETVSHGVVEAESSREQKPRNAGKAPRPRVRD